MTKSNLSDPRRYVTLAQPRIPSNAIRYWRKRSPGKPGTCLTQRQLARIVGKSAGSIGRFERGERFPKMETLLMIGAALRVPPQSLYPRLWGDSCSRANDKRRELGLIHDGNDD